MKALQNLPEIRPMIYLDTPLHLKMLLELLCKIYFLLIVELLLTCQDEMLQLKSEMKQNIVFNWILYKLVDKTD